MDIYRRLVDYRPFVFPVSVIDSDLGYVVLAERVGHRGISPWKYFMG